MVDERDRKITELLLKYESVLKDEIVITTDPDDLIDLANSLEIVIDLRKKLASI